METSKSTGDSGEGASYGFKKSGWTFNEKVAKNWHGEMEGHIPDYWHVIKLSSEVVSRLHDPSARILIFWAATGNQWVPYQERGWDESNFFGINYSEPLHKAFCNRLPKASSRLVDEKTRPYNPVVDGPFDVVQMHWSLHFEPVDKRTEVLKNIYSALNEGGTLLLTDKTKQSSVVEDLFHDYKRSKGISDEEIAAKKNAIAGVLKPLPSNWPNRRLKERASLIFVLSMLN